MDYSVNKQENFPKTKTHVKLFVFYLLMQVCKLNIQDMYTVQYVSVC